MRFITLVVLFVLFVSVKALASEEVPSLTVVPQQLQTL